MPLTTPKLGTIDIATQVGIELFVGTPCALLKLLWGLTDKDFDYWKNQNHNIPIKQL